MSKKRNLWKGLFIGLVAVIVLGVAGLFIVVTRPSSTKVTQTSVADVQAAGTYTATTTELNALIASYLAAHGSGYQFSLDASGAVLTTNYNLLGQSVPLVIRMTPVKSDNGNMDLHVTQVEAGSLTLPTSVALGVAQHLSVPSFVKFDSNAGVIHVELSSLDVKGFTVKVQTIDLAKGQYIFALQTRK
ncbi:MAG: DUF2140 family protein [Streptococcaceae bacterium]|jgi:uncharacterized protein YpmS|nr:DUF2140 family protein [Streptococcaceae bacterium]